MQHNFTTERMRMLPFDFNPSLPPTPSSATFTQPHTANVAFFGEQRVSKNLPAWPIKGNDCIFFSDPGFTRDVQDFFGFTGLGNGTRVIGDNTTKYYNQAEFVPVYNAKDHDLFVWKNRVEGDGTVMGNGEQGDQVQGEVGVVGWQAQLQFGQFDECGLFNVFF
ncbi:hypothetical protein EJ02DRAFT_456262 [Clathrospora elynae]|uniref:Uncharacterized protein n=1 Tax=Clathrospora elynae TaxID=706981 RepID=A0A6A5SLA0_9PLEO|nr:hypothetical protein EJ02DRAFT_456262 [Clathrospora elynae]